MENQSKDYSEEFPEGLFVIKFLFVVALVIWLGFSSCAAPHIRLSETSMWQNVAAFLVGLEITALIPEAQPRIEPYVGNNLKIFITKENFESVPYPDRKDFVSKVGKTWCNSVDSFWLLPSVYIRDIKSGKELASYSCTLRYAQLKKSWRD